MGKDRSRVLGALIAYLVLVIASLFVMDWFVMKGGGAIFGGANRIGIDLRSVTVCTDAGPCVSVSFSGIRSRGMFPMMAFTTFWGTAVVSLLIGYQAVTRIISGFASASLTKMGTFVTLGLAGTAGAAAYLFGPEVGAMESELSGITIERTWAPLLLILGHIVGIVTMHWASSAETLDGDAEYKPLTPALPAARVIPQTQDIRPVGVASERTTGDGIPELPAAERPATGPVPAMPDHLRKKVNYTTLSAEVTRAGIDARREDGSLLLVLWRDVVGVVVRRLPPEHDGATFVDIVSTAGATLRLLPWTRTTGDLVIGAGDDRVRSLLDAVIANCPTIKLDARTQAFRDKGEAAQLPDLAKLAQHDARLA